jgi:predicted kinase
MYLENLENLKEPFVIILCGPPLSGKTTFIKKYFPDKEVISRDEILMEVYGSRNYSEAFKNVNQNKVDETLRDRMVEYGKEGRNVLVDMTNLTKKSRRKNLSYFGKKYYKLAVAFPILSTEEYKRRNDYRNETENKYIPSTVLRSMISNYVIPSLDEGFNEIIIL